MKTVISKVSEVNPFDFILDRFSVHHYPETLFEAPPGSVSQG